MTLVSDAELGKLVREVEDRTAKRCAEIADNSIPMCIHGEEVGKAIRRHFGLDKEQKGGGGR